MDRGSSNEDTGVRTVAVPPTDDEVVAGERADPPASLIGDRYQVARRIGKGGMGEVMVARDQQVGRDVAIKRMRSSAPSQRAVQRFLREASIQGRLEHPAIVPVHEIGYDDDGLPYFVMKKLAGTTLAKILEERKQRNSASDMTRPTTIFERPSDRWSLQRILRAFADVCVAVEFAHVRGIIHRDLKPDNIMLGDFGEVYVLDWGVAKVIGEPDEFADVDSSGGSGENATIAGTSVGTPGYMAPEQIRGDAIDGRADVYTLGCLLFEILAGEPLHPRGYQGLQNALLATDNHPATRAPTKYVPPELDALCANATRPDREVRIATARELGDRVMQFLDGDRDLAHRRALARGHLERARSAFASASESDTDVAHADAMREAGAALALDPEYGAAAELVGRLMIEPPRKLPAEVEQAMHVEDVRGARVNAQAGLVTVLAGIGFSPLMYWMAPSGSSHVTALVVTMILLGILSIYNLRIAQPLPGLVVVGNAILVAIVARMFSPMLVAPGLAAVLAMSLVITPRFSWMSSAVSVAGSMLLAVLGAWALEWLGVLSSTLEISRQGVVFHAPAIAGNELPVLISGSLYVLMLISVSVGMGETVRRRSRDAHRKLLVQTWQLRQLVRSASPSSKPAP